MPQNDRSAYVLAPNLHNLSDNLVGLKTTVYHQKLDKGSDYYNYKTGIYSGKHLYEHEDTRARAANTPIMGTIPIIFLRFGATVTPGDLPASHAVESLYHAHHAWLKSWLRRRLNDDHDAADLAQDTFVRLLSTRDTPLLREPRAFLTRVAQGLVINLWRRRDLEHAYLQALALRPADTAPSPEQRALVIEALVEIDAMLHRQPARAREAFLLAQLGGLSYAEIAARLAVSDRMVKKYMAQVMLQCLLITEGLQ